MDPFLATACLLLIFCCGSWLLMARMVRKEIGRKPPIMRMRQLIEEYELLVDLGRAPGLLLNLWILSLAGLIGLGVWKLLP